MAIEQKTDKPVGKEQINPTETVTREQILFYRGLTSLLSRAGKSTRLHENTAGVATLPVGLPSSRNNTSFVGRKGQLLNFPIHYLYYRGRDLANLLVRDTESVTVAFDASATTMTIVKLEDREKFSWDNDFLAEKAAPGASPKDNLGRHIDDLKVGPGYYLLWRNDSSPACRNSPPFVVPPFVEHAAIVRHLIQECYGKPSRSWPAYEPDKPRLAEYIWVTASPIIRHRIAVGGAPQFHQNPTYHRNIFWVLTKIPPMKPHCASYDAIAFRGAEKLLTTAFGLESIVAHSGPQNFHQYHKILSDTLIGLYSVFERIGIARCYVLQLTSVLRSSMLSPQEALALRDVASQFAGQLNMLATQATGYMDVLGFMLTVERDELTTYLKYLGQLYHLQNAEEVHFDADFFRNPSAFTNTEAFPFWPDAELDSLPTSNPLEALGGGWTDAAVNYLDSICEHWVAITSLQKKPRHIANKNSLAHYANMFKEMRHECIEVDNVAFDKETVSVRDIVVELHRGPDPDDKKTQVVRRGLDALHGTPFPWDETVFNGQHHGVGLILSLHLAGRMNPKRAAQGASLSKDSPSNEQTTRESGYQEAVHTLSEHFGSMCKVVAASQPCCPGCFTLALYINEVNQRERLAEMHEYYERYTGDRAALRSDKEIRKACIHMALGRPTRTWSPCTIPPWTPRHVAEVMIRVASKEVIDLIQSVCPKRKRNYSVWED